MKIQSQVLGQLEYDEAEIITFPEGIPAFENEKSFLLIPVENSPFCYLQAINNTSLCLLTVEPFVFFPDYQLEIADEELHNLQECKLEDLGIYLIVTVAEEFNKSTANLMAPVIINYKNKKALQFVPPKSLYNTKHPLFKQPVATGEGR